MKCPHCLQEISSVSRFCSECGFRLTPEPDSEQKDFSGSQEPITQTMDTPCFPLQRGLLFAGRYEIIEELGQGGMGCVYRAEDKKINEEVALKLIRSDISTDQTTRQRFHNELKIARKIAHKHVCRTFHIGESGGTTFITMELILGEDLKSTIRRFGQLPISKSIALVKQVCDGLAEAHELGIVHRDLKPRNIMIDSEGNAKVMDFGIARTMRTEGITRKGMTVGTPEYISPEQVEGNPADQRSDLYSLGVTFFEMVTGEVPFKGDSTLAIALKHKIAPPPLPRKINPRIPEPLSRIILKCLEKDPAKRFQSAVELKKALTAVEQEISTGQGFKSAGRTSGFSGRKKQKARTLLSLMLFFVAATTALLIWVKKDNREPPPIKTVALMPFRDISLEGDQQRFCETLSEATTRNLTYISQIQMRPYSSVKKYAHSELSQQEIGRALDVDFLAFPTIQVLGNRIRVSCEINDVRKNVNVGLPFEQDFTFEDFFEIQDAVVQSLVKNLRLQLTTLMERVGSRNRSINQNAIGPFIEGSSAARAYQHSLDEEDFKSARKNLEAAVEEDSRFVEPLWWLGEIYHARFVAHDEVPDYHRMIEYYERAHALNADLPETNVGLGWACFYSHEFDKAYRYYRKAMKLGANFPEINQHVAGFLKDCGLYERAVELQKKAISIDPTDPTHRENAADCLSKMGRYEEAAEVLRSSLERWPNNLRQRLLLARQLIRLGRMDEADKEIAIVEAGDPENAGARLTRAWIYAADGDRKKALEIISGLDRFIYTHLIADVYALLGMKDEAIKNIQDVIDRGFYKLQTFPYRYLCLKSNPFFDSLRSEEKFASIMSSAERDYKIFRRKYGKL